MTTRSHLTETDTETDDRRDSTSDDMVREKKSVRDHLLVSSLRPGEGRVTRLDTKSRRVF